MYQNYTGCLLPEIKGQEIYSCSIETCSVFPVLSIRSAWCPINFLEYKMVNATCVTNKKTEIYQWVPALNNCLSVNHQNKYFYGSLYAVRQLQNSIKLDRMSINNKHTKPFSSPWIAMSVLGIALVMFMMLGVYHRSSPNRIVGHTTRNRPRRHRVINRVHQQSVGIQAELPVFTSSHITLSHESQGGLNEAFYDCEPSLSPTVTLDSTNYVYRVSESCLPSMQMNSVNSQNQSICQSETNTRQKQIFNGVPCLPTYKDATKVGFYCIVKDRTTPPPKYISTLNIADLSDDIRNNYLSTSTVNGVFATNQPTSSIINSETSSFTASADISSR